MAYKDITPPAGGKISIKDGVLTVPDNPVIPFIRGDGTGRDIWKASEKVFDAAVKKAYGGKKKIAWFEVFAGEASDRKSTRLNSSHLGISYAVFCLKKKKHS